MSAQHIGAIFSYSHVAQVLALLSASVILKKLGDIRGIAWCQLATGVHRQSEAADPPGPGRRAPHHSCDSSSMEYSGKKTANALVTLGS
jgi:hypothetical protein